MNLHGFPHEPESCASANFATSANIVASLLMPLYYTAFCKLRQVFAQYSAKTFAKNGHCCRIYANWKNGKYTATLAFHGHNKISDWRKCCLLICLESAKGDGKIAFVWQGSNCVEQRFNGKQHLQTQLVVEHRWQIHFVTKLQVKTCA